MPGGLLAAVALSSAHFRSHVRESLRITPPEGCRQVRGDLSCSAVNSVLSARETGVAGQSHLKSGFPFRKRVLTRISWESRDKCGRFQMHLVAEKRTTCPDKAQILETVGKESFFSQVSQSFFFDAHQPGNSQFSKQLLHSFSE